MAAENIVKKTKQRRRQSFKIEEVPLTDDTTCGFGPCKGGFLQKFATKKVYIVFYALLGMANLSSWAYYNGTISTMEKRFKIPSRITGLIVTGSDISGFFTTVILSYWAGTGHRPRWIAFGTLTSILFMWITALPHFIYGPGEDALKLTKEYALKANTTITSDTENSENLCERGITCVEDYESLVQPLILFLAQFIGGIGALHHTVGLSYIDDNIKKKESPLFFSISWGIRMLGPALGYAVASYCLKIYISPTLTPTITPNDPRWLGAWWLGWLIYSVVILVLAIPISLFPKVLPEMAALKAIKDGDTDDELHTPLKPSIKDMFISMKRLFQNKIYFYNNIATVCYFLGEEPYWIYLSKYIETQFRQTASDSNIVTGTVGLGSTAIGLILSGLIISKTRPAARSLAAWNVFIGFISICGLVSYAFIDCEEIRIKKYQDGLEGSVDFARECNAHCDCEFIPYSPVCSEKNETFISACHAGCQNKDVIDGKITYSNCSCVEGNNGTGSAVTGLCPVDCTTPFYTFLAVLSLLKLMGSSGIASNFLVGVRCIDERDKSLAMGLSLTIVGTLAFAPAPVLYGYIIDTTCLVWGKTCSGQGNCWLYDGENLALVLNLTAACFVALGTLFDIKVWYESKHLKIFD